MSAIKLYLIPFYGLYNVDGIKPAVISEFHVWRRDKVGRELSGSAQNNHNAALNLIFDESIELTCCSEGRITAPEHHCNPALCQQLVRHTMCKYRFKRQFTDVPLSAVKSL